MATSIPNVWRRIKNTVSPGDTVAVDILNLSVFNHLEYIINIKNSAGNLVKSLKLSVKKDDSSLEDSVFVRLGQGIDVQVTTAINGSDYELRITNNEAFILDVNMARALI